jgi:RHS repeat-associated protein
VLELRTFRNGATCVAFGQQCPNWPGFALGMDGGTQGTDVPTYTVWWGDVIRGSSGTSGLQYLRNRYYDPRTGRFTQLDPIGLAGGLNLYGFAGGDPVNFSDPFGLCTPWPECYLQSAADWGARRGGSVGNVVLNLAAAGNAAAEALGVNDVGRAAAEGDVVGGTVALAGMLPSGRGGKGLTYLYQKVGRYGEHLKFGITKNPATRYTRKNSLVAASEFSRRAPGKKCLSLSEISTKLSRSGRKRRNRSTSESRLRRD